MPIDRAITFGLDIARLDAHTRAQVVSILKRMEKELIAATAAGMTDWNKARVAQQLAEAQAVISQAYSMAAGVSMDTTNSVYQISATEAARTLAATVGDALPSALPSEFVMRALASDAMIMGAVQKDWWMRQSLDAAFRFSTAIRQGIVTGEPNQRIIQRVRSELDVTRRNAASLVQTSVQTVANNARLETFEANTDIMTGLKWLSTLDSRTCTQCAPRDGMTWKTNRDKLSATLPFANPPLHYNCRCVLVPLTRFSLMGKGQRASKDGPVDRTTTFTEFLDRKGTAFQDEVLGKGRADLYRQGKITLTDLVNGNGKPLTIGQLKEKYS